jgi:dephospho-CoA kinase
MNRSPARGERNGPALVVGLTGGIGTGKTTVAQLLGEMGATVVDCDALGRQVVEPGGRAYAGVVDRFGPEVVGADGRIDRPALAAVVFGDTSALADLNRITHPAIDAEIAARIASAPDGSIVVLDMAVLVETDLGKGQYEVVVVVEAPLDVRLRRLAARGISETDARARIASQADDTARRAVGDIFLRNDGGRDELADAVAELWADLRRRADERSDRVNP